MGKMSRLGNALYEGDTSIEFVGRRWLWYTISGIIVVLAVAGLYFPRDSTSASSSRAGCVHRQRPEWPGHPGDAEGKSGRCRHRARRRRLADREGLGSRRHPDPDRVVVQRRRGQGQ